jgi:hypothetical protein
MCGLGLLLQESMCGNGIIDVYSGPAFSPTSIPAGIVLVILVENIKIFI